MATFAPYSAKRTAMAWPMPDVPPVTRTFLPFRPRMPSVLAVGAVAVMRSSSGGWRSLRAGSESQRVGREERVEVEEHAARDEEDGDEHAETGRLQLRAELRVRHRAVAVDEREHGPGEEGAEDDLETQRLRQGDEADEQEEGAPHTNLRGRVLQPQENGGEHHRALYTHEREHGGEGREREAAEQHELRADAGGLAREEEGQEDDGAEVRHRGRGDDQLPEVGAE